MDRGYEDTLTTTEEERAPASTPAPTKAAERAGFLRRAIEEMQSHLRIEIEAGLRAAAVPPAMRRHCTELRQSEHLRLVIEPDGDGTFVVVPALHLRMRLRSYQHELGDRRQTFVGIADSGENVEVEQGDFGTVVTVSRNHWRCPIGPIDDCGFHRQAEGRRGADYAGIARSYYAEGHGTVISHPVVSAAAYARVTLDPGVASNDEE